MPSPTNQPPDEEIQRLNELTEIYEEFEKKLTDIQSRGQDLLKEAKGAEKQTKLEGIRAKLKSLFSK